MFGVLIIIFENVALKTTERNLVESIARRVEAILKTKRGTNNLLAKLCKNIELKENCFPFAMIYRQVANLAGLLYSRSH